MSGFKFRNDYEEENEYGQLVCYTKWIGGPSIAGIKNCNSKVENLRGRTAFIIDSPDTFFSQPARVNYKGKSVKGFITCDEGEFYFTPNEF